MREWDGWPIPMWGHIPPFLPLRKSLRGMGGQLLHVAFYSFLILLKQNRQGWERGGGAFPTWCPLFLYVPFERKTNRARRERERERDGWTIPTWPHLFLSNPSKRKTDNARFERDVWPTHTWGLLLLSTLPQRNQTGLGKRGMGGHFLHGTIYSFLFLLKDRQTRLGEREREREG